MLEGMLVDLVPYGKAFTDLEHKWRNNDASFFGSGGDRYFVTQASVQRMLQEWAEERDRGEDPGVAFGIQTKDGKPIGYMGINWLVPYHRLAMLGAKIGEPEYWGGGYGTDALLLLLDYAFDWLDLHKAWLMTTTMNHRVMRQMEKVGFTLEAQQRKSALADGVWYDWLAYGLLREEWPGRAAVIERIGLRVREET
jgi:RimJ/RimL family protein N-acetyltransferase